MAKQAIAIIILSIIVILGMPYAQAALQYIVAAHGWVAEELKSVFSGGPVGDVIRQLLALLVLPVMLSLIPVIILWLAKRAWFEYFMEVVWILWMMQTAAVIIVSKAA